MSIELIENYYRQIEKIKKYSGSKTRTKSPFKEVLL